MEIKVIIVDLDKTLLHSDKTVSKRTEIVLNECRKKGIKLLVATARPLRTTIRYAERILFDGMVVSNGARLICGNTIIDTKLNPRDVENVLEIWKQYPTWHITLETGDQAYSNLPIAEYETIICDDLIETARMYGALKLLLHVERPEMWNMVEESLPENVNYTVAHGTLLQIQHRQASKWNGIKTLLEQMGCNPQEAIYFGDDYDDVESIQNCGIGIAMANGIEEAKKMADHVVGSNDEDGVAEYLSEYFRLDL